MGRRRVAATAMGSVQAECGRDTRRVTGVCAAEMLQLPALDGFGHTGHVAGDVVEQGLLLRRRHQAEQRAGLRIVVFIDTMAPAVRGLAVQRQRRLGGGGGFAPLAETVRLVVDGAAQVAVYASRAVAMEAVKGATRRIDGYLVVIDAQPIAVRVPVREEAALQHLVG